MQLNQFQKMKNKQNSYYQNQISTGINDSTSFKSSYSNKFLQTIKKNQVNKILPSKYQKSAKIIQRFWRLRQSIKRKVNEEIYCNILSLNQCYQLQNKVLSNLIQKNQKQVIFKQKFINFKIKQKYKALQNQISQIKKQCVIISFKFQKKNVDKKTIQTIINKRQQQKQLHLKINRQKMLLQQEFQKQKKVYSNLLNQINILNSLHLQLVKQKTKLKQKNAQKFLQTQKNSQKYFETSKIGSQNFSQIFELQNKQNQAKYFQKSILNKR